MHTERTLMQQLAFRGTVTEAGHNGANAGSMTAQALH
jgi:hypothetical protein